MVRAEGAAPRRTGAGAGRGRGVLGRGRARSSLSPPPQLAYHTVLGAVFRQKREMKRYKEQRVYQEDEESSEKYGPGGGRGRVNPCPCGLV